MSDISKKTLLLVEDEPYTAKIISAALKANDFDVIIAESGENAIDIINSRQIVHLILMDIVMKSGIDGIEAAKIILQDHDIPLIFLSGYSDVELLHRAEQVSSYGFILKQSDYHVMVTSIKMALNLYDSRQKIRQEEDKRKAAEETLKEHESVFFTMFADNPIPMMIYEVETLKILEVNNIAMTHYGCSRDEFLAMTIADMIPAEDIPKLIKGVSELGKGASKSGIWRHLKRDGTMMYVDITSHSITYMGKNARFVLTNDVTEQILTKEKLEHQYSILQGIIESADALIFSVDNNGAYTCFNKSHAAMMKLINGEDIAINQNMADYIRNEKEREIIKQTIDRTLQGEYFSTEHFIGYYSELCFEIFHNPIRSADGEIVGAAVFARDISERKKSENTLKENEAVFRLMFDDNLIPMWLYDTESLQFLEVNHAAVRHYGYSRDEFLAMTIKDIRPVEDVKNLLRIIPKDKPINKSGIWTHLKKDGTRIQVEITSHFLSFLGKPARLVLANDVTERILSQQKLAESQQRLTLALEIAKAGAWEWKASDKSIYWTEENYRLIGLNPEKDESSYRNWIKSIHPEDRRYTKQIFNKAFESCGRFDIEYRIMLPNGDIRWLRSIGYAESENRDNTCSAQRMIGLQIDITEQKETSEKLIDQYSLLKSVMESIDAAIFSLDARFRYTSFNVNHACMMKMIYGTDIEIGKSILNYIPHEEDRNKIQKAIGRTFWGERFTVEEYSGDESHRQIFEVSYNPIKTITGKLLGAVVFARDITERKKAEETIKAQNEFLNMVINSLTHPFYVIDAYTYKIKIGNKSSGFDNGQDITCYELTHNLTSPCQDSMYPCAVRIVRETKRPVVVEHIHYDSAGKEFYMEIHGHPIFDAEGNVIQVIEYSMDITERKKAELALQELTADLENRIQERTEELFIANAALEKAARLKDEFLASMSHELRTPLTGILNFSEALQEEVYGPLNEKQIKAIRTIESSGQHLLDLITDILDLSKIEAGQMEIHIEKCSVKDICQASIQLTKGMANKKHHKVSFSMNPTSISMDADPRRLKQMLVNILSNAVKFTPDSGQISLEVRKEEAEQKVYFIITDTGIGIAAEMFDRLFKPFVQLDSRLSRQYSGTGLGLSLVRRMAELHGGSIDLESKLGKGSRFTITLPCIV